MAQRCHKCGLVAPDDRLMHKYYPGPRGAAEVYCPACWAVRQSRTERHEAIAVAVAIGVLAAGAALAPAEHGGAIGRIAFGIIAIEIAATFLHELGHALGAKLMGMKVFKFSVGMGRTLYSRRLGGTDVEVRLLPVCGYVRAGDTRVAFGRTRNLVMIAAGPGVNIALAALGFAMVGDDWSVGGDPANVTFWHLLAGINTIIVAFNLFPMVVPDPGGSAGVAPAATPNDGMLMLMTLLARGAIFHHWLAQSIRYQSDDLLKRGDAAGAERVVDEAARRYPQSGALRVVRAQVRAQAGRYDEARDELRDVLEIDRLDEVTRLLARVALAEAIMDSGRAEWVGEADRVSEEAMKRAGDAAMVRAVRGRVLVATGWVAKGCAMLHQVLGELSDPKEQAEVACHLALAELEQRDPERATHYAALARSIDPTCRHLPAVEAEATAAAARAAGSA